MSSSYTKDLDLEVVLKLNGNDVFDISKVSTEWSNLIVPDFWVTKFIRGFGSSLPVGANYELEYITLERLPLFKFYYPAIRKGYINLINISLNRYPTNIDIAYIAKYGTLDILKLVLSKQHTEHLDYALIIASEYDRVDIIEFLLANGADIHASEDEALIRAAEDGRLEMVKLLLANEADIHAQGDLTLISASRKGNLEVVKLLIANGADIHVQEDYALRIAASNGHLEVVKFLLANGADIHAQNDQALIAAAANGELEIVKLLLDNGADIHAGNDEALRLAAHNGHLEVVKLLLDNGADINTVADYRYNNKELNSIIQEYKKKSTIPKETTQCTAFTLKGTQCKKKAVKNGLCSIHSK